MHRNFILAGFFIASIPATEALAQHCQPYWTAQYKCAMGCGPCGGGGGNVAPQPYVAPQPSAADVAALRGNAITAQGVQAEKAGNWALAVSLYEQALRLRPHNQVIMDNLGHARAAVFNLQGIEADKAGNLALAIVFFERALQADPKDASYARSRASLERNIAMTRARMKAQDEQNRQRLEAARIIPVRTAQTTPAKNISNEWVCPPNLPQLASNPARSGEADGHYCIAKNSIACGGPSKSWACEVGHSCNGDGSDPKVPLCR